MFLIIIFRVAHHHHVYIGKIQVNTKRRDEKKSCIGHVCIFDRNERERGIEDKGTDKQSHYIVQK